MKKNAIVAGTGFEGRNKVIRSHCKEGAHVILKRDLENKKDKNAIAVYIETPVVFWLLGRSLKQIGFIKASTAKSLARKMDAGEKLSATIVSFWAPPDKKHPRVTIEITDET